jgi:hypothetical protein
MTVTYERIAYNVQGRIGDRPTSLDRVELNSIERRAFELNTKNRYGYIPEADGVITKTQHRITGNKLID